MTNRHDQQSQIPSRFVSGPSSTASAKMKIIIPGVCPFDFSGTVSVSAVWSFLNTCLFPEALGNTPRSSALMRPKVYPGANRYMRKRILFGSCVRPAFAMH